MAQLTLAFTFDDAAFEQDFYNVFVKQNLQRFMDELGLQTEAELATVTDKEKRDYVTGLFAANATESYEGLKLQQSVQAFAESQASANSGMLVPTKPLEKRPPKTPA